MRLPNQKTIVLLVATLVIASVTAYAVQLIIPVKSQTTQASSLGQSIQDLTQGIIGRTNQQVQNTLENAGQQALPQLVSNASQYDCIVVIMHFGKASGAMTCSPDEQFTNSITVNSQNAPGSSGISSSSTQSSSSSSSDGSAQSSIQRQGGATSMQNQMTGSGSSANVISGHVP